jgi:hypothetical protein
MTQAICTNNRCEATLSPGDQFCGECGTPVLAVSPTVSAETIAQANGGRPFFSHEPRRASGPLNNTTRYLCAAAYLERNA